MEALEHAGKGFHMRSGGESRVTALVGEWGRIGQGQKGHPQLGQNSDSARCGCCLHVAGPAWVMRIPGESFRSGLYTRTVISGR